MPKIVAIHGINQEYRGRNVIQAEWLPALKDGLELAGAVLESDRDFHCGYYGDLFRGTQQQKSGDGIPLYSASDLATDWEREFLESLWTELSTVESQSQDSLPKAQQKARTPRGIQAALRALSQSQYFGGAAEKLIIFFLKQVRAYIHEPEIRAEIRQRVSNCIESDTRVLMGHSLGSIACYESLCLHPEWPVTTFISLGSPLGIPRLIFDRLEPLPLNGQGQWPGAVKHWVNIADVGDIVALQKELDPLFAGHIEDIQVDNGSDAHNASRYLTARETGAAVKLGLTD